MITLKRISPLTGIEHSMDLPINQTRINELHKTPFKWQHPTLLIQDAFPELTPDQREFILTGITPEEWDETLNSYDEPTTNNEPITAPQRR